MRVFCVSTPLDTKEMMYYHYIMLKASSLLTGERATVRTQISLTPLLKQAIEAKKRLTGESVSAYLRKAAVLRLLVEEEEKGELERLAENLIGSVSSGKHKEWRTKKKLQSWLERVRGEWE